MGKQGQTVQFTFTVYGYRGGRELPVTRNDELELDIAIEGAESLGWEFENHVRVRKAVSA